jgi:hypothetical protein
MPMIKWISIKDEKPPLGEYVLLFASSERKSCLSGPKIFVGFRGSCSKSYSESESYYDSAWGDGYIPFEEKDVTHWALLPETPEIKQSS